MAVCRYELVHYASFFQKQSDNNYNTTATYTLLKDGALDVVNTTFSDGEKITSHGVAHPLSNDREFRVDFDAPDVAKFLSKEEVGARPVPDPTVPNFIVRRIWLDKHDKYAFALITDADKQSMWVLSREKHPSQRNYQKVMACVNTRYDRSKFLLTPQYT